MAVQIEIKAIDNASKIIQAVGISFAKLGAITQEQQSKFDKLGAAILTAAGTLQRTSAIYKAQEDSLQKLGAVIDGLKNRYNALFQDSTKKGIEQQGKLAAQISILQGKYDALGTTLQATGARVESQDQKFRAAVEGLQKFVESVGAGHDKVAMFNALLPVLAGHLGGMTSAAGGASSAFGSLTSFLSSVVGAFRGIGAGAASSNPYIAAFSTALGFLRNIASGVIGILHSLASAFGSLIHGVLSTAAGIIRGVASAFQSLFGWIGNIAQLIIGVNLASLFRDITSGLRDIVGMALEAGVSMQALRIRMEGLIARDIVEGGIGGITRMSEAFDIARLSAQGVLDWIQRLAIISPFTRETLANVFTLAEGYGFVQEEAKELTLAVGRFAAGMGLGDLEMQRIIVNFGQMQAAGKVLGTELRDLARGAFVPINRLLEASGKILGKTIKGTQDLAAEGQAGIDAFIQAFVEMTERDFPDAMRRMAETWRGAWSNMVDLVQILGSDLFEPLLGVLGRQLFIFTQKMMKPEVRQFFTDIGDQLAGITEFFLIFRGPKIVDALGDIFTTLGDILGLDFSKFDPEHFLMDAFLKFDEAAIKPFIEFLESLPEKMPVWAENFGKITTALDGLGKSLRDLAGVTGLTALASSLKNFLDTVGQDVNVDSVVSAIDKITEAIGHGPQMNLVGEGAGVPGQVGDATGLVKAIGDAFGKGLEGALVLVQNGVGAVGQAIVDAVQKWIDEHGADTGKKMGEWVGIFSSWLIFEGVPIAVEAIYKWGKQITDALLVTVDEDTGRTVAENFMVGFSEGFQETDAFESASIRFRDWIESLSEILVPMWNTMIANALAPAPDVDVWASWRKKFDEWSIMFQGFIDSITLGFVDIQTTWQTNWDLLGVIVSTAWENIKANIVTGWEFAKIVFLFGFQGMLTAAGVEAKKFLDIGTAIIDHIIDGVVSKVESLVDAVVAAVWSALAAAYALLEPIAEQVGFTLPPLPENPLGPPGEQFGGPIQSPAIVGEAGPELFVPGTSGRIYSLEDLKRLLHADSGDEKKGGNTVVTYSFYAPLNFEVKDRTTLNQLMNDLRTAAAAL